MLVRKSSPILSTTLGSFLACSLSTACGDKAGTSGGATDSATGGSSGSSAGGSSGGTTAGSSGGGSSAGSSSGTGSSTGTSTSMGTFGSSSSSTTGGPMPNGSECVMNEDCESMFCYDIPSVGGRCSECLEDADCMMMGAAGTCALDFNAGFAVCTDGGLGAMCMSDAGCQMGLVCATLVDTGGIIAADYCSECATDMECAMGELCTPIFDEGSLGGHRECAPAGSVANDSGCDLDPGSGDEQCMSGVCAPVSVMGFLDIGVCGQCKTDMDCMVMGMGTCTAGTADMGGLVGSTCN